MLSVLGDVKGSQVDPGVSLRVGDPGVSLLLGDPSVSFSLGIQVCPAPWESGVSCSLGIYPGVLLLAAF